MSTNAEIRSRAEANQVLPVGQCTRCTKPTGKEAPHYARIEIDDGIMLVTLLLPFCDSCVGQLLEMGDAERRKLPWTFKKTA